jgi:hypothetical protein
MQLRCVRSWDSKNGQFSGIPLAATWPWSMRSIVAPMAFQGILRISALLTLIAALLNIFMGRITAVSPWLTVIASLTFAILAVVPMFFETILYREFVDPLFKKAQSVNVIGTLRKPGTENVKRLLILGSHHDSGLEFTWLRFLGDLKRPNNLGGQNVLKLTLEWLSSGGE